MAPRAAIVFVLCTSGVMAVPESNRLRFEVAPAWEPTEPERALCSPCIQLGGQSINILLNEILNAGVMGGCGKLCSHLKTKSQQTVCDLACSIVGIRAFIKALNHTDLDPIYFCEEVHACAAAPDNASATLGAVSAQPPSVAKGSTVEFTVEVEVKAATGVGQFRLNVDGPVTQPVSSSFLLPNGIPAGTQTLAVKLTPKDDDSGNIPVTWRPGSYSYAFEVCQGECESKHPHSKVFGKKAGNFTLTETRSAITI